MEKDFQEEMLNFKEEMSDFKEEMSDFKEEMLDFKEEMLDFKDMTNKKFEQNDIFQKEMSYFKKEMLDFKGKTTQTLDDIHKIVILIENELHEKVTTLFDAYSFNNDEHQVFETRLCDLENLALKNSTKISALEDITKLHSKQLAKSNS